MYQGPDEQLLQLQLEADNALGLGRGISFESVNQRKLMLLPPPMLPGAQHAQQASMQAQQAPTQAQQAHGTEGVPGAASSVQGQRQGQRQQQGGGGGGGGVAASAAGFVAVDQLPGMLVTVHDAHMGCGMGGCNVRATSQKLIMPFDCLGGWAA